MLQCKAKFCNVKRGQGISAFAIPDPKNRQHCQQWIHNLGTKNLDIKTYKYSKQNIVCEKHFEGHEGSLDPQLFRVHRKDTGKPGHMPRLIRCFNVRTYRNTYFYKTILPCGPFLCGLNL